MACLTGPKSTEELEQIVTELRHLKISAGIFESVMEGWLEISINDQGDVAYQTTAAGKAAANL